jgi:hypothetical protein
MRPRLEALARPTKTAARWFGATVLALVLAALVTSTILSKDHLAFPLGPGCYWQGLDSSLVQWQHCDQWRAGPGAS